MQFKRKGDSFHIVFHDCVDAVSFAFEAQQSLHDDEWGDDILALPEACDNANACFRGLRARMAIHYGNVGSKENIVSSRREYFGPTTQMVKSLEHMAHGGQILFTVDVWNLVSYVSESKLGRPQVIDLGTHALWLGKKNEGLIEKGIVQLVPSKLSFDYTASPDNLLSSSSMALGTRGPTVPASHCQNKLDSILL